MVRWLELPKETEPSSNGCYTSNGSIKVEIGQGEITDDPLACLNGTKGAHKNQIYSVTRSVMLPRLSITKSHGVVPQFNLSGGGGGGVNPLFKENHMYADIRKNEAKQSSKPKREKSGSSGYSSNSDSKENNNNNNNNSNILIVGQNQNYVKSIRICKNNRNFVPSFGSGSSSSTLNAIPEGKIVWDKENYDSIVDDALLLYTSLNYAPENERTSLGVQLSVTELLVDILKNVNTALDGNTEHAEDVLKTVTNKINLGLEVLKNSTEDDMKKLCINLRNCKKVNSVLRAFSNSSSPRSSSSETDDFYQSHFSTPSSRSVGSSDSADNTTGKIFRNVHDDKPSVWEQYYGVQARPDQEITRVVVVPKPTDVPIFPGGRPEADFTLDVPRSEHLNKKMKQDKKWRFRCRLLTSFLGLVFFLLSVMAVSLMLTRGKRMFGSMM